MWVGPVGETPLSMVSGLQPGSTPGNFVALIWITSGCFWKRVVAPHSASSTALLSPSSSSRLVYKENCRWSLEQISHPQTTASPPADRQTGAEMEEAETEIQKSADNVFCLIQSASYIESQVIGPLAYDTVTRMAVIGHLELENVITTRSIAVLIEQNTRTCTSCRTHRQVTCRRKEGRKELTETEHGSETSSKMWHKHFCLHPALDCFSMDNL